MAANEENDDDYGDGFEDDDGAAMDAEISAMAAEAAAVRAEAAAAAEAAAVAADEAEAAVQAEVAAAADAAAEAAAIEAANVSAATTEATVAEATVAEGTAVNALEPDWPAVEPGRLIDDTAGSEPHSAAEDGTNTLLDDLFASRNSVAEALDDEAQDVMLAPPTEPPRASRRPKPKAAEAARAPVPPIVAPSEAAPPPYKGRRSVRTRSPSPDPTPAEASTVRASGGTSVSFAPDTSIASARRILSEEGEWLRSHVERLDTPARRSRVGVPSAPLTLADALVRPPHKQRKKKHGAASHKMPRLDLSQMALLYGKTESG